MNPSVSQERYYSIGDDTWRVAETWHAQLACEMPILFSSDNGRPGRLSLDPRHKSPSFYRLFSSNTEQLLQVGNSHLKHLYLVFMKQ